MALYLPTGPLKTCSELSRYRDANPVPTSPLADDLTLHHRGQLIISKEQNVFYMYCPTNRVHTVDVYTPIVWNDKNAPVESELVHLYHLEPVRNDRNCF